MELIRRPVDVHGDRQFVLDLRVLANQASGNPAERAVPRDAYRAHWLVTSQPDDFWEALKHSRRDHRTIADVWLDGGRPVGWAWVTFSDVPDYEVVIAELQEIAVAPAAQRHGIGTAMLRALVEAAVDSGATLFRSEVAIGNPASLALHASAGMRVARVAFALELSASRRPHNQAWGQESAEALESLTRRLQEEHSGVSNSPPLPIN